MAKKRKTKAKAKSKVKKKKVMKKSAKKSTKKTAKKSVKKKTKKSKAKKAKPGTFGAAISSLLPESLGGAPSTPSSGFRNPFSSNDGKD